MAFTQFNPPALGTTVGLIAQLPSGLPLTAVTIGNNHASAVLFIGSTSVTSSGATQGIQIAAKGNAVVTLNSGDKLYGISSTSLAAGDVSVLYSGV